MCDPITLLTLAGTAVSAISSISQGRDASQQAEFQAATQRQQATRERDVAAAEEDDFRRRQSRTLASKRATLGGAGIEGSTGTPLLATKDFVTEAELQALRIRSGGETTATRLEQQALLRSAAGRSTRRRGFTRAGASLLTGFGKHFGTGDTSTESPVVPRRITGTQSTVALNR